MYSKRYKFKILNIDVININDKSFCISYPEQDDRLTESIKNKGIIQPLLVKDKHPFNVISGFKRLKSAIDIGLKEIPCLILDVGDIEACHISINENLMRPLNIVEKAHCVNMILNFGLSMTEIYEVMGQIGLAKHESIMKKMIKIANSEKILKDYIASRNITMKNIDYLLWFEPEEREIILSYLNKVHLTDSLLREILQMLTLIKLKTDKIPFEILNESCNPYELKKNLKEQINPRLTKLENEFKHLKHSIGLPNNIDILIDPFFEKEYIDFKIKAKEVSELEFALNGLMEKVKSKDMERIFGITKNRLSE